MQGWYMHGVVPFRLAALGNTAYERDAFWATCGTRCSSMCSNIWVCFQEESLPKVLDTTSYVRFFWLKCLIKLVARVVWLKYLTELVKQYA